MGEEQATEWVSTPDHQASVRAPGVRRRGCSGAVGGRALVGLPPTPRGVPHPHNPAQQTPPRLPTRSTRAATPPPDNHHPPTSPPPTTPTPTTRHHAPPEFPPASSRTSTAANSRLGSGASARVGGGARSSSRTSNPAPASARPSLRSKGLCNPQSGSPGAGGGTGWLTVDGAAMASVSIQGEHVSLASWFR